MRVAIDVMLKPELLDPQGRAVAAALEDGGDGVSDVRVGKHLEITFDGEPADLDATVAKLCDELLVNGVIETYDWRVIEPANA